MGVGGGGGAAGRILPVDNDIIGPNICWVFLFVCLFFLCVFFFFALKFY